MKKANITDNILSDEAVRFISERHHATVADVLDNYMAQSSGTTPQEKTTVNLEENEVQIIHDLISMYDKNI